MDRVDLSMPSLDENPIGYTGDLEDEKELEELLREERRNECQRITKLTDSHFEKISQKG
jgi:hypothetical protein